MVQRLYRSKSLVALFHCMPLGMLNYCCCLHFLDLVFAEVLAAELVGAFVAVLPAMVPAVVFLVMVPAVVFLVMVPVAVSPVVEVVVVAPGLEILGLALVVVVARLVDVALEVLGPWLGSIRRNSSGLIIFKLVIRCRSRRRKD